MDIRGGFKSTYGGSNPSTSSLKLCYNPKNNKGFRSYSMYPKPFIPAVSPIFCSFPLYQISGLHFAVCRIEIPALFLHIAAEHDFLILYGNGLPGSFVITTEPTINSNIVFFLHLVFYLPGRRNIASVTCSHYSRFSTVKQ